MRKRILILLAMLVAMVCLCSLSAAAVEEKTIVRYCEYCDLVETWYPLDNTTLIESKHYYLNKEEMKQIIIESVNYAMDNKFEVPMPLE